MSKKLDLLGQKFGRLLVISPQPKLNSRSMWLCRCDCGQEKTIMAKRLISGHTKSCGCLKLEILAATASKIKHGCFGTPTYNTWGSMKQRCLNANFPTYNRYGGRGILVCDKWLNFEGFLEDMGLRPSGKTLDRINNDGNYELENCRWASAYEQNSNRGDYNNVIFYCGEEKTIAEWGRDLGMNRGHIRTRMDRNGWSFEEAVNIPFRKRKTKKDKL